MAEVAPVPPETGVQPDVPSGDCSHWIAPVYPVNVMEVPEFAHIGDTVTAAVPATLAGSTVTITVLDVAGEQVPLVILAR